MTTPRNILTSSPEELADWFSRQGQPAYRLPQVLDWLFDKFVMDFQAMSNLPTSLREALRGSYSISAPRELGRQISQDQASEKFLFELADGEQIETVWMSDEGRTTFCVSSQAGCAVGCRFCATGQMGLARNLHGGEIVGQVLAVAASKGRPNNVVFMGMGEPLLNVDGVIPALHAMADERRLGLGVRRISVSTAGIVPGIKRLSECSVAPNLAVSVNSPFEAQRSELMPISRRYPLSDVLAACRAYAAKTGRRVLFEYVLLGNVNTSADAARELAKHARETDAAVNLIPFNSVADCGFRPPMQEEIDRFRRILGEQGVRFTQRYRRGRDITAACGQLRGRHAVAGEEA